MKKAISTAAAALTLVFLASSPALAGIEVSPSIVIFETSVHKEQVITVTNAGNRIAYVTTEPRRVTAPGQANEKLQPEANAALLGLLSSPARLVLEPGERRGVRVVAIDAPGASDRIWRVKIVPIAGKLLSGQSGVAMLVGYDALVIQRPSNPNVAISGTREPRKLRLFNTGNSFAMINEVRQCQKTGPCTRLGAKRLYGGQDWVVDLPLEGGTIFVAFEGLHRKKEELRF